MLLADQCSPFCLIRSNQWEILMEMSGTAEIPYYWEVTMRIKKGVAEAPADAGLREEFIVCSSRYEVTIQIMLQKSYKQQLLKYMLMLVADQYNHFCLVITNEMLWWKHQVLLKYHIVGRSWTYTVMNIIALLLFTIQNFKKSGGEPEKSTYPLLSQDKNKEWTCEIGTDTGGFRSLPSSCHYLSNILHCRNTREIKVC